MLMQNVTFVNIIFKILLYIYVYCIVICIIVALVNVNGLLTLLAYYQTCDTKR